MIRLHPAQTRDELEQILAPLVRTFNIGPLEDCWCHESVLPAAMRADVVVSFPSSAVMDAIAAGTPAIEYFDYHDQDWNSFVDAPEGKTSIYRQAGLVAAVNTPAELADFVRRTVHDSHFRAALCENQRRALAAVTQSSLPACDIILQRMADVRTARLPDAA